MAGAARRGRVAVARGGRLQQRRRRRRHRLDGGASGTTAQDLSGTITISGSSTVQPITSLVAELFNEDVSSDVSITVDGPGTGDGFVLFCDGETDISDASRPIEDEEEATACADRTASSTSSSRSRSTASPS